MIGAAEMKVRLTAEQKQFKLNNLAELYTDTAIKMASRPELADWCEGIVPSIKSKRKDDLADALVEALKETRERIANQIAEAPTATDHIAAERKILETEFEDPTPEVAGRLYKTLAEIAQDANDADVLLNSVLTLVSRHVAREIKKYQPSSIKNRKTRICKMLRANVEGETIFKKKISDTVEAFIRRYHKMLSEVIDEVNTVTRTRVVDKGRNKSEVDGNGCLEFARDALTKLDRWMDVSIALILATGRRMAEIHSTETVFTKVDDYTLSFEGQLKTKGRGDIGAFNIPCLVPADMVLAGVEYLGEQGKLYSATEGLTVAEVVNAKVSVSLSRAIKANMTPFGINVYKDCRVVYAEICWETLANKAVIDKAHYFSNILGHSEKDVTTANSYIKFQVTGT